MSWTERIRGAVDALRGVQVRESSALLSGADPDLNLSAAGGGSRYFRPLTASPKDIRPYDHRRMLEIAVYLYQSNPLAKRIIERRTNFILGEGVRIVADDKKVQDVIDEFWTDPINKMDRRLHSLVNAWRAYGELILPVTVDDDGLVRVGFMSPDRVNSVVPNPLNIEDIHTLMWDPPTGADWQPLGAPATLSSSTEGVPMKVIRVQDEKGKPHYKRRVGEAFYFTANRLPDMVRGMSDLWAIADYCDAYETTIWDLVERAGIVNSFIIHVTKTGATPVELNEWWNKHGSDPPRAGEIIATNEKEEWEFLTPNFAGQNVSEWSDLVLSMIATGADMPKFWLNAQLDPNRAAAEQMAGPVVKGLTEMQREMSGWIEDVIDFVIDQAIIAKQLPSTIDRGFVIEVPEISGKDLAGAGQTFLQTTQGVVAARAEKLIDEKTGRRLLLQAIERMGVITTLEDVEKEIEKEKEEAEKEAAKAPQPGGPMPGKPMPGVPGAENTGSATKAGAPRKVPTPRVAHSEPEGSMSGLAAGVREAEAIAADASRILDALGALGPDPTVEKASEFVEAVRNTHDGERILGEIINAGSTFDSWVPRIVMTQLEKGDLEADDAPFPVETPVASGGRIPAGKQEWITEDVGVVGYRGGAYAVLVKDDGRARVHARGLTEAQASVMVSDLTEHKKGMHDQARHAGGGGGGGMPDKDTEQMHKGADGKWTAERLALHSSIIEQDLKGKKTSDSPRVFMTGGGSAAGKSALKEGKDDMVLSDADEMKAKLPEYLEAREAGAPWAASHAHNESSHLSKKLIAVALDRGHDVLYDSTGDSSFENLSGKVQRMREAGAKRVDAEYALVPTKVALERNQERFEKTGRLVPPEYVREVHRSVREVVAKAAAQGTFDSLKVWDTSRRPNTLIAEFGRGKRPVIERPDLWAKYTGGGE